MSKCLIRTSEPRSVWIFQELKKLNK